MEESVAAALTTATDSVKKFFDFLALFRSDVQVFGSEFTLDDAALIAELAHQLQRGHKKVSVIYPGVGPVPGISPDTTAATGRTSEKIWPLLQELVRIQGEAKQRAQGHADLEARLKVIDSQLDALLQGLAKPDAASGVTLWTTLVRAEALQEALQDGQILFVKIVRAGVGRRVVDNFLTRIFYSYRISHTGGAVVTFMVLDKAGKVLLSRTLYSHSGYTKFSEANPRYEPGRNFRLE